MRFIFRPTISQFRIFLFVSILIICTKHVTSNCNDDGAFFGHGTACGDQTSKYTSKIDYPNVPLVYFGRSYSSGMISTYLNAYFMDSSLGSHFYSNHMKLPAPTYPEGDDPAVITPFYALNDFTRNAYKISTTFRLVDKSEDLQTLGNIINEAYIINHESAWKPSNGLIITLTKSHKKDCTNDCSPNAYQLTLAWSANITYAIVNYKPITWTSPNTYAGLNIGDGKGFYPFSTGSLTELGNQKGFGKVGRFIYKISGEEPKRGGCLPSDTGRTETLFVNKLSGSVMGGDILVVSGPCINDVTAKFSCVFTRNKKEFTSTAIPLSVAKLDRSLLKSLKLSSQVEESSNSSQKDNYLFCVTPQVWFPGSYQLNLTYPEGNASFISDFRFVNFEENVKYNDLQLRFENDSLVYQRQFPSEGIRIFWNQDQLGNSTIRITIYGYKEQNNGSSLVQLQTVPISESTGSYLMKKHVFKCTTDLCSQNQVGFIAISSSHSITRTLWTNMIPLGWFINDYMEDNEGSDWSDKACKQTSEIDIVEHLSCPCNIDQAEAAIGIVMETNFCPRLPGNNCSSALPAQRCFIHIMPYITKMTESGPVGMCCYIKSTGGLLYGENFDYTKRWDHGSHTLSTPITSQTPYFSSWHRDSLAFLQCCRWSKHDQASPCPLFWKLRPTISCQQFSPGLLSSGFGDPHFILNENKTFTFNAKGEFWLLKSASDDGFKIQVRTFMTEWKGNLPKATFITRLAIQRSKSIVYEIFPSRDIDGSTKVFVIKDDFKGTIIDFWDAAPGYVFKEKANGDLLVYLWISKDEQVALRIVPKQLESADYLNVFVGWTRGVKNMTGILVDLMSTENTTVLSTSSHKEYDEAFRLKPNETLFTYSTEFNEASINDENFRPQTEFNSTAEVLATCKNNTFCMFDAMAFTEQLGLDTMAASIETYKLLQGTHRVIACSQPGMIGARFDKFDFSASSSVTVIGCLYTDVKPKSVTLTCTASNNGTGVWLPENYEINLCETEELPWLYLALGLVGAVLILILLIVILTIVLRRPKRRQQKELDPQNDSTYEGIDMDASNGAFVASGTTYVEPENSKKSQADYTTPDAQVYADPKANKRRQKQQADLEAIRVHPSRGAPMYMNTANDDQDEGDVSEEIIL